MGRRHLTVLRYHIWPNKHTMRDSNETHTMTSWVRSLHILQNSLRYTKNWLSSWWKSTARDSYNQARTFLRHQTLYISCALVVDQTYGFIIVHLYTHTNSETCPLSNINHLPVSTEPIIINWDWNAANSNFIFTRRNWQLDEIDTLTHEKWHLGSKSIRFSDLLVLIGEWAIVAHNLVKPWATPWNDGPLHMYQGFPVLLKLDWRTHGRSYWWVKRAKFEAKYLGPLTI